MATNNNINSDIPIEITKGGTAAASLTDHSVLVGSGTAAVTPITVGTDGQVVIGATAADPAFGTLTSTGGTIDFTTGANSLNVEVSGGGGSCILSGTNRIYLSKSGTNPGYLPIFKSNHNSNQADGTIATTAAVAALIMPISGTISDFYVNRLSGTGNTTHTVHINTANTTITVSHTTTGIQSDTVTTAVISAGDWISVQYTGTTDTEGSFSMLFTAT